MQLLLPRYTRPCRSSHEQPRRTMGLTWTQTCLLGRLPVHTAAGHDVLRVVWKSRHKLQYLEPGTWLLFDVTNFRLAHLKRAQRSTTFVSSSPTNTIVDSQSSIRTTWMTDRSMLAEGVGCEPSDTLMWLLNAVLVPSNVNRAVCSRLSTSCVVHRSVAPRLDLWIV